MTTSWEIRHGAVRHPDGTPICWIFTEITADSFHWTGEALQADGRTWKMEGEFRAKRMR